MIIFSPQPQSWGLASLGLAVPQGVHFDFALAPMVQPTAPAMQVRVQPQQQYAQAPVHNPAMAVGQAMGGMQQAMGGMQQAMMGAQQMQAGGMQGSFHGSGSVAGVSGGVSYSATYSSSSS